MNLLDRLITNENSMTEALAGLLAYKVFRDAFVTMVATKPYPNLDEDCVETQVQIKDCGIPDLLISNDDITILVEVKCSQSRGLTENQPKKYLEWLIQQRTNVKILTLLSPPIYKHMEKYKRRIKCVSNGVETKEIAWTDILMLIEDNGLNELNQNFCDFSSVLRSWFVQEPISLNRKELEVIYNQDTPAAIEKLFGIIDGVIRHLKQEYDVKESKSRRWWEEDHEYGCYLKLKKKETLWFGIWTTLWQEKGIPVSLGVDKGWKDADKFRKSHPDSKCFGDYYYLEVKKDMLESEESVQKIIDKIEVVWASY